MKDRVIGAAALCAACISIALGAREAKAQTPQKAVDPQANLNAIGDWMAKNERLWREIGAPDFLDAGPDNVVFPGAGFSAGGAGFSAGFGQLVHTARHGKELGGIARRSLDLPPSQLKSLSRISGVTQSESSVAWCGSNAVVGFNDSSTFGASILAVLPGAIRFGLSFNGFATSSDAGETFTHLKSLLGDPGPFDYTTGTGIESRNLFGDPVLACSNSNTFYYSSLAIDYEFDPCNVSGYSTVCPAVYPGITVSISSDGGQSFARTVAAIRKPDTRSGWFHFLDKEWLAVTPRPQGDTIHVTYTDFDYTGFETDLTDPNRTPTCDHDLRTAIEYVRSTDGGATWSRPIVLDERCGSELLVTGSQVKAGVGDDVLVAWEDYRPRAPNRPFMDGPRNIRFRRSNDRGASFGPAVNVSNVVGVGDGYALQGGFRTFIDLQGLAVDRSGGPNTGAIYVSWQDGRNREAPESWSYLEDRAGLCTEGCVYRFSDILFSRSTDGGATWSAPVRVNNDPIDLSVDHFQPALTVDRNGLLYSTFYDRRRDPQNYLIDAYLATSRDGGRSWSNRRLTREPFAAVTGAIDYWVNPQYIGDYVSVAGDSTGSGNGVITTWTDISLGDQSVAFLKVESDDESNAGHQGGMVEKE